MFCLRDSSIDARVPIQGTRNRDLRVQGSGLWNGEGDLAFREGGGVVVDVVNNHSDGQQLDEVGVRLHRDVKLQLADEVKVTYLRTEVYVLRK